MRGHGLDDRPRAAPVRRLAAPNRRRGLPRIDSTSLQRPSTNAIASGELPGVGCGCTTTSIGSFCCARSSAPACRPRASASRRRSSPRRRGLCSQARRWPPPTMRRACESTLSTVFTRARDRGRCRLSSIRRMSPELSLAVVLSPESRRSRRARHTARDAGGPDAMRKGRSRRITFGPVQNLTDAFSECSTGQHRRRRHTARLRLAADAAAGACRAMCSRMAPGPAWHTRSWRPSPRGCPTAASLRCAISFPTWSAAPSGPMFPRWPMPPSARPSWKRRASFRGCRWWRAANPSVDA